MSAQIWKYHLKLVDEQHIEMPKGAKVLSAQMQSDSLCIWALVRLTGETEKRRIFIHGTGHQVYATEREFVGTVQTGCLVWHIFDGGSL